MMNYITKIQSRVNILAKKKTGNLFDGSYKSVYTGNGFDFENLREYVPGDNVRDIDWKASARSKNLLIKQYIAEKKHNILLVFDTGKGFLADSDTGETKRNIALNAGGTFAYLSAQNGDNIGALYNRNGLIQFFPLRTGLPNLERIMTAYDKEDFSGYDSDLNKTLDYVVRNISKRSILFVVTDAAGIYKIPEITLRRLAFKHDVLFISITDAPLCGADTYSVSKNLYISEYISKNKQLQDTEQQLRLHISSSNSKKLIKHSVISTEIGSENDIVNKIMELLERHKYATIHNR